MIVDSIWTMTWVNETPISSAAGAARPIDNEVLATDATDWLGQPAVVAATPTSEPVFQVVAAQG